MVGASNNTVDTTNAAGSGDAYDFNSDPHTGASYTFTFDNLALDYETTYLALFTAGNGDTIKLDITQGFEGDTHVQAYDAGVGGFDVGGVFDYDASGWSTNTNADFAATFETSAVPVPAAAWLFGSALALGGVLRKRSRVLTLISSLILDEFLTGFAFHLYECGAFFYKVMIDEY